VPFTYSEALLRKLATTIQHRILIIKPSKAFFHRPVGAIQKTKASKNRYLLKSRLGMTS